MTIDIRITKRFKELITQGEEVLATRKSIDSSGKVLVLAPDYVDSQLAEEWSVSSLSFIGRVLGKSSEHYQQFFLQTSQISTHSNAVRAFAVLRSSAADYKGGYLFDTKSAITADVFDEFLEQASYFLGEGYFQVAAVVAGAVLEDTLRRLCSQSSVTLPAKPKLDSMNSDLAKAGVYDKMMLKKVTWLADIRNKAAHGKWNEFTQADSEEMIKAVRRLVEDYISK